MRTILTSADFQDAVVIKDIPDTIDSGDGILEMSLESTVLGIQGRKKVAVMEGLVIEHNKAALPNDTRILVRKDTPHLELHLELNGFTSFSGKGNAVQPIDIHPGSGTLLYLPELDGQLNFAKNEARESLEIEFTEQYLGSLFQDNWEVLGRFGKSICTRTPAVWNRKGAGITPDGYSILWDIIQCQYDGLLKKIYLESKVRELLVTFMAQNPALGETLRDSRWSKADRDKLHYAREVVAQRIHAPYSIVELSRVVGLNDFKLKKGFKEFFGTTIFGYIHQLRMSEAKRLLADPAYSIADIAFRVGFKNPQHFTAAFKRRFGVLPTRLRK